MFDSADPERGLRLDPGARRAQVAAWDRVLHRIFSSGLVVAVALGGEVDDDVRDRLRGVVDELDRAVGEIRDMALELAVVDGPARAERGRPFIAPVVVPDANPDGDGHSRRRLLLVGDAEVFAYSAFGTGFVRASDRMLWAHEHDGLLLSARSGAPLAQRVGSVFYELESNRPLYFEDTHPPSPPDGDAA